MNCPIDNTPLAITERQGIEIDYCPKCRGVWLDRGELDKLIERNSQFNASRGLQDDDDDDDFRRQPAQPGYPPQSGQQGYQGQNPAPYPPQQGRPAGSDIAGMVGDLLNRGLEKRREGHHQSGHHKKKKGGLLGDLFDF